MLWVELFESKLTVHYAIPTTKEAIQVASIKYPIEETQRHQALTWADKLLNVAYGKSQRRKRIKVLLNPAGGKGKALEWYERDIEPVFVAARCEIDVVRTRYQGHAVELAERLDVDAYDVVACCSGDGLPHEVFNGFGKRKDAVRALRKIAVVQLPCGSGNAMCWNLTGTGSPGLATLRIVKSLRMPLDLISITQGGRRTLSFLSQSVGVVAETDLGTENLRWMGENRFVYGLLVRLIEKRKYPCDIAIQLEIGDKADIRAHYERELHSRSPTTEGRNVAVVENAERANDHYQGLPQLRYGTATDPLPESWRLIPYDKLSSFYAGNMAYMTADGNFFPASLPVDGCLDLLCIDGDLSRTKVLRAFLAVSKNEFFDLDYVSYRKVLAYRIIPKGQADGYISIDGERIPFEPFQAEVHRGLGTVLSMSGHLYEAPGVSSAH